MNITEAQTFPVSLPLKKPFKITLGTMTRSPHAVVRIITDEGIVGYAKSLTTDVNI
jgi:L-alanine-DL-glutamate epimerase-like enolase superfamily enzyme